MTFVPAAERYQRMSYNRCGRSGLQLPAASLGLWHNFGDERPLEAQRAIVRRAFDLGVTQIDLANTTAHPSARRRRTSEGCSATIWRRSATSSCLDQGRLQHVARPVRQLSLHGKS